MQALLSLALGEPEMDGSPFSQYHCTLRNAKAVQERNKKMSVATLFAMMVDIVKNGGEVEVHDLMNLDAQLRQINDLDSDQKRQISIAIDAIIGGIQYP